ncbi:hypothetical protein JYK14_18680 [Siccirubricoccus sp. KC 17139]|uniref:HEPN domain-containing protein n=1 Tax=Siccirubricoccus soli TaxID=2899147 RepID=A0ABT1D8D4_9PROT|nr:hypothetical protein [Siccirubricoccus soli]MCO6418173.1 hypothetical protein [Siccirubricoccus soli]MCP2684308.1 hypothetical protein [Siccirubricoccus soli]
MEADALQDRHSPIGIYYLAEDFLRAAAQSAMAQDSGELRLRFTHFVTYHLHCHSIELALKAFLRARHVSNDALKFKYGHNLKIMLRDACAEGLALQSYEAHTHVIVDWLNACGKAQTFRYSETGYFELPALTDVRATNERLLSAVKSACLAATRPSGSTC